MRKSFTDHFAPVAVNYADSRPTYPPELFDWLAAQCPGHGLAWDCGAGSGQASLALANFFAQVVATDASSSQLAQAPPHPKVRYRLAAAEDSGLYDGCADLVTVAQALHWFDVQKFFAEVQRVLKPGGLFAAWSYGRLEVEGDTINHPVQEFYHTVIGPYWPPERRHVENGYCQIDCPLPPVPAPVFAMVLEWSLPQLLRYIRSWSATARFLETNGYDPVEGLGGQLAPLWGGGGKTRRILWPLTLMAGRKPGWNP